MSLKYPHLTDLPFLDLYDFLVSYFGQHTIKVTQKLKQFDLSN